MSQEGTRRGDRARREAAVVKERRAHQRFLEEVTVRFRDLEGLDPSRWGRSRDLSLGGICLLCPTQVVVGTHLALEIHIDSEPAPVLALGRVLRCEAEEQDFVSGIQFLWVSEEDRANLRRLADHFRARYGHTGDLAAGE